MRIFRSRKWRAALLTWAFIAAAFIGTLYRYWSDATALVDHHLWLRWHRENSDPICRGTADGSIAAGDSVEQLIAEYPPQRVYRLGRFVVIEYPIRHPLHGPPTGGQIIAMEGRLVRAYIGFRESLGGGVMFDTMTPADEAALFRSRVVFDQRRREAWMSVTGAAVDFNP